MKHPHALTIDVEDWFQVQALAGAVDRAQWDHMPRRVEANTDRILQACERAGARGTFFTLGWVAERHPALIRRIVAGGHELASHGHGHQRVHEIGEKAFIEDITRARAVLQDTGGVDVVGYRAPTFSIGARTPWAYAALARAGYRYSSSIYPIAHDLYGAPDAPREPYRPQGGPVWEIPMTTLRLGGRNLPCSGGGFFRLLPYALYRQGLRRTELRGIFYTHPWEIDPDQPRVDLLHPSVGDRPRPAPRRRALAAVALPAQREPLAHGGPAGTAAAGLHLGPHGPRLRRSAGGRAAGPRRLTTASVVQ